MRTLTLTAAVLGGLAWATIPNAQAADPHVQLLPNAVTVQADGSTAVQAIPVRIGYGWRGPGYYPGFGRPYYGGGFRGSYGYYGNPYYGGGYYGSYYRGNPYYYGARPYYYGGGYYWR